MTELAAQSLTSLLLVQVDQILPCLPKEEIKMHYFKKNLVSRRQFEVQKTFLLNKSQLTLEQLDELHCIKLVRKIRIEFRYQQNLTKQSFELTRRELLLVE